MRGDRRRADDARWSEHRIDAGDAGSTVGEILRGRLGVSGRRIQKLTRSHGFRLNGRPTHLGRRVREGDVVACRVADTVSAGLQGDAISIEVLYEDAAVLVVDKPAGVLVHPTSGQPRTLAHGVAEHLRSQGLASQVHPVHRLDRETSGAVLFAKTAVAHHKLAVELAGGRVQREYLALVTGSVQDDHGTIDQPIGRHPTHHRLRSIDPIAGAPAVTRFIVEERFRDATLVRAWLETGRTHQIRVHFAAIGHPLLGDRMYGGRSSDIRRQALHAAKLSFRSPAMVNEPITVAAPLPADLLHALARRRAGTGSAPGSPATESSHEGEIMENGERDRRTHRSGRGNEAERTSGKAERDDSGAVPGSGEDHSLKPHGDPLTDVPHETDHEDDR